MSSITFEDQQLIPLGVVERVSCWTTSWVVLPRNDQEVVAFGSPSDAGLGGRLAVREHGEALQRLADA